MNNIQLSGRIVSDISYGSYYKQRTDTKKNGRWCKFVLLVNTTKNRVDTFLVTAFGYQASNVYNNAKKGGRVYITGYLNSTKVYDYATKKDLYVTNVVANNIEIIDYKDKETIERIINQNIEIETKVVNGEFPNFKDFKESHYNAKNDIADD